MTALIDRLCREHRNIGGLLRMLDRKLDAVDDGSESEEDIGLMRDIMTYMTRFPDHTHHPMEDLIFRHMRARELTPRTEATIAKLLGEHAALARKGEALHLALRRFGGGTKAERQALVAMGRDYVEFLRYHAKLEEETVFVEAGALLDDAEWSDIARAFETRTDPVFGPSVDREFRALYQHIQNSAYLMAHRAD